MKELRRPYREKQIKSKMIEVVYEGSAYEEMNQRHIQYPV